MRSLSRLSILTDDDLARIHDASVRVLEEAGMVFQSQKALDLLAKHGAKVTGKTAYIPRTLIEKSLSKCPKTFTWRALDESKSVQVGSGLYAQAGGGSVYIQDMDNGRRPSKLADFINIQKLYQTSDVIDIAGFSPVDPSDLDAKDKHLYMQYEILKNCDKPVHGHVCGGPQAGQMLDMIEIAFGEDNLLQKHHVMGLSINSISPLGFGEDQIDTLFEYASRNQIIIAAPMAIGGASAPLSHVGMTVLVNAEILAIIVLTQLINPGNPIFMAPSSSFADMRTGAYSSGIPDGMLHLVSHIQLCRDYYKLPARVLCGSCDSKEVDAQAGYETMQNIMTCVFAGAGLIAHVSGVLEGIMTISYEKMIIDEELVRRAKYMATRSIDVSDEALSVDVIKEVGSGGTFLTHQSVYDNCRGYLFTPGVSDWLNHAEWQREGSLDVVARANKMFKERLAAAPESLLDSAVQADLQAYIEKHKA
ncbi:MAG: trimethylamine methyltransferase family protein [Bacillota bacterium]|nr:trimethylamine methyltransferase family protein [Bacillota bacterium]